MANSSTITNETSYAYFDIAFSYHLRVWLYLVPNILSILCSIFALYHFLFKQMLRQAINNHVIIILIFIGLIYELTSILWAIHYYYFRVILIQTSSFALAWSFIDYTCWLTQLLLFAWATIERHILVFYDRWVSTKKKRIFIHYLPIILILIYCYSYCSIIFFATTCTNIFDYTQVYGMNSPCILKNPILSKVGWTVNQIIPTFIIIFFSLTLLLRIILQKRRLHRSINWRKQRKMIIQLLSISFIYLVLYVPYTLLYLAYNLGLSRKIGAEYTMYAEFFAYYITFLLPFIACGTLPELGTKIKKLFCCYR